MPVLLVYPDHAMEIYSFQGTGNITRVPAHRLCRCQGACQSRHLL